MPSNVLKHQQNDPAWLYEIPGYRTEVLLRRAGNLIARFVGMRRWLFPHHVRSHLQLVGIDNERFRRLRRLMRRYEDWPAAFEAEANAFLEEGDIDTACMYLMIAHRPLLPRTPEKHRLYQRAQDLYRQLEHLCPIEYRTCTFDGIELHYLLQVPAQPRGNRAHVVILAPGATGCKEESFGIEHEILERGYAVARMEMPGFGDTEAFLNSDARHHARAVFDSVSDDPRIYPNGIHMWGVSLGAIMLLHSSARCSPASVTVVSGAFAPGAYHERFPAMAFAQLHSAINCTSYDGIVGFLEDLDLSAVAGDITTNLRIYHGAQDRLFPLEDAYLIRDHAGGPTELVVFENEHHGCRGKLATIVTDTLDWMDRLRANQLPEALEHAG